MTVEELREALKDYPPDMPVMFQTRFKKQETPPDCVRCTFSIGYVKKEIDEYAVMLANNYY